MLALASAPFCAAEALFSFNRDAFKIIEAESADRKRGSGIELDHVKHNMPGFWLAYEGVNFSQAATAIEVKAAAPDSWGVFRLHLDGIDSQPIAEIHGKSGSFEHYQTFQVELEKPVEGRCEVYFVFESYVNLDWFRFLGEESSETAPYQITSPLDGASIQTFGTAFSLYLQPGEPTELKRIQR